MSALDAPTPLSPSDRAIIAAVVDNAPPLGDGARDRLRVILGGA